MSPETAVEPGDFEGSGERMRISGDQDAGTGPSVAKWIRIRILSGGLAAATGRIQNNGRPDGHPFTFIRGLHSAGVRGKLFIRFIIRNYAPFFWR